MDVAAHGRVPSIPTVSERQGQKNWWWDTHRPASLEYNTEDTRKTLPPQGRRQELTPKSCPLFVLGALWHMCALEYKTNK